MNSDSAYGDPKWEVVSGISGSVYQFWQKGMRFDNAKAFCTAPKAHLIILETKTEYDNIKPKLLSFGKYGQYLNTVGLRGMQVVALSDC